VWRARELGRKEGLKESVLTDDDRGGTDDDEDIEDG
jgi:hypothetical protein